MGRGRPAHRPTEQSRMMVRRLAGMATPHDAIALFVEISDITLRKHYRVDLDRGHAEANLKVVQSLFRAATRENNPSVVAQMFWLKNQAGWKEHVAPGEADGVTTLQIEFVGPHALADAVRATRHPVINGTAEPEAHEPDVDTVEDAALAEDADAEVGDVADDAAEPGLFEAPLPDPDPEP
jgi:hypothetical protein